MTLKDHLVTTEHGVKRDTEVFLAVKQENAVIFGDILNHTLTPTDRSGFRTWLTGYRPFSW